MIDTADGVAEHLPTPRFAVVGIGTSAGGVAATKQFFENTASDSGMAYVVVLHLSEDHESHLAQILQTVTTMPVVQVNEVTTVEPNHVYVIPPAKHILLDDDRLRLIEPEHVRGRRVPIDLFFRSLAEAYGKNAVAVVLTGTGSDGTLGLERVKEMGGFTVVQDPEEAEYDGMPRSAIGSGLIDFVLPISEIPDKLRRVINLVEPLEVSADSGAQDDEGKGGSLREVLSLVQIRTGHDFNNYKRPTLRRRIARRLQVHELTDLGAYVGLLRSEPEEVEDLLRDLLITVTNFFRDPEAFAALETQIVPKLFEGKTAQDTVRVWVAGCGTGEEAYSIGMLLLEYAQKLDHPPRIQIFASDINAQAIRIGRDCKYDEAITVDVSPERLERFFIKEGNLYRVKKELRELVLFAPHNLLRDPPFSKLDLVTCRNLLIYLNRPTQERVIELFHFSLIRSGYLFLGSSESIDSSAAMFDTVDKRLRLYRARITNPGSQAALPPAMPAGGKWLPERWLTERSRGSTDGLPNDRNRSASFSDLHNQLLEQLSIPSVLIDNQFEILHASDSAVRFLRFTSGEPTHNLLKVVLPGLVLDLRAALMAATREGKRVEARYVRFDFDGVERSVNIDVRPEREDGSGLLLVMFEDQPVRSEPDAPPSVSETLRSDRAIESVVQRLEDESQAIRERLKSTVEQYEISTEELKASNEELQAINEELRSASEELETSKEELQSLNEELITVNHELKDNIEEVSRVNSDLQNLMASSNIATIFLDRRQFIKRFTPPVKELFNLIPSDIGRPLAHVTHNLVYNSLSEDVAAVLATLNSQEREITSATNDCVYLVRLSPYRTSEDRIDGVVLSFVDITERKRSEDILKNSDARKNEFLATLSHELRNPLNALRSSLEVMSHLDNVKELQIERQEAIQPLEMMRRLIDDLMDVGRVSQGKMRLRLAPTPLASVLERCVQMLSTRISDSGLTFHLELPAPDVTVSGDAVRLEQVFLNLISNAIKYSHPSGQIRLTVKCSDAEVEIHVRDTGIGLANNRLTSIFELFSQVKVEGTRTQDGLGIGLYLVKQIIELHGGTVSAQSDGLGRGSEFTVRLPMIPAANATPQSALSPRTPQPAFDLRTLETPVKTQPSAADTKRWRILLADDYEPARKAVARLLKYMGHEIFTAVDGPDAVEKASEFSPELILLDINMPGMTGYEVARTLRSHPEFADTVLIALTGYGQPEDIERALKAGFNGHIVKPLDPDGLETMLLERSWASAVMSAD